jgi:hypothetical protein
VELYKYGSTSGSGRLWRKTKKFLYFVFLLMILTLNVYHTRESLQDVKHHYSENYSTKNHQKKEDIMETKKINSDNQTEQKTRQTSTQDGSHF